MRNLLARISLLAFVLALFAPVAIGQTSNTSAVTGIVTDATGAVIPGTKVTLTNPLKGIKLTATTGSNGSYRIIGVPAGPGFNITFEHAGFSSATAKDLYLQVGITRTQDTQLAPGSADVIEVSARADEATLNTTDASIGSNIDQAQVNTLPIQNRLTVGVLMYLQPGVNTQGSATGARTDQNNTTVDGLDTNDIAAGGSFGGVSQTPVDAIQEFRGTTAGFPSSVGTGSGGQFQLVTKSGTNNWHGRVSEYHRDAATASNLWFNKMTTPVTRRPNIIQNQFGANLGGPVLKNKLFFFFNFDANRTIQPLSATRTVPLDNFKNGQYINYRNTSGGVSQLPATGSGQTVLSLDPGHQGWNQNIVTFLQNRYPTANTSTVGDSLNTGGYLFNQKNPIKGYSYVGRVDYNLTKAHRVFGRFNIYRLDQLYTTNFLPTDPITSPYQDHSYSYTVGDTWTIGSNKVNQFQYGDTIQKVNFPILWKPSVPTVYSFSNLSGPYTNPSEQKRRVPIPMIRDDFSWTKGHHTITFGGQFKWIKTNSLLRSDYNYVSIGYGIDNTMAAVPSNLSTNSTYKGYFNNAYAVALGNIGEIDSNYNYNSSGSVINQGTGAVRGYRYFQTEVYAGDTWKATPSLTLSYGLRYQLYSVPYEVHGEQSQQNLTFDQLWSARKSGAATATFTDSSVPFSVYTLSGKANKAAPLYSPNYKDIAPRFAFAYNPESHRKIVLNGGVELAYDRTVINAINFIQDQSSFLFQNSISNPYNNAVGAGQRVGANLGYTNPNTPLAITNPYTPYVSGGFPYGLINNEFNFIVDPKLKDPYSIVANLGIQAELPGRFLLKTSWVGRYGRRLIAQADASALIDSADKVSGQLMSKAFANIETELRNGVAWNHVTAQPWFENVALGKIIPGYTNSQILAYYLGYGGTYLQRGDMADSMQFFASTGVLPSNAGLASQFAGNTFVTNKGNSSYNGLLVSVTKNPTKGLMFDFNYTFSKSMDNVSAVANSISSNSGTGQICDPSDISICRAVSDFDITHTFNANFVYQLPFGRGRGYLTNAPKALDYLIGGWDVSGITGWRTGVPMNPIGDAFLAGYANEAPLIFNGNKAALKQNIHKSGGTVQMFADPAAAASAFSYPTGLQYGSRNMIRGPGGFNMDLGIAKSFPIYKEAKFTFRADLFNAFNHPLFANGNANLNSSSAFGQISGTAGSISSTTYRIAQFAGRIDF